MHVLVATTCTPDDRKTLCAVRALGHAGATVTIASDRLLGGACHSRFVRRRVAYVPVHGAAATDVTSIAASLTAELQRSRYDVLLPMNDYTTLAVATHRASLERYTAVMAPPLASLLATRDKLETVRLAERLGVEAPATHLASSAGELWKFAERIPYPCVLKPRKGAGGVGLVIADSPQALLAAYEARPTARSDDVYDFDAALVQEFVPGEVHDVCALMCRGEPVAALTQRRLLTYPRRGGVGIANETTHEPALIARALTLLRALAWHGPAQVEFKVDAEHERVSLMEINGRFWGTLDLAVAAGIDVPTLACRLAIDGTAAPVASYTIGLRYRWPVAFGLLAVLEGPEPWRTLRTLLQPSRASRSDLCLTDPLPHLAELAYVARRMGARRSLRPERTAARPGARAREDRPVAN